MKSVSFVPKTIPAGGASRSPLDRFWVDWHRSKRFIFIYVVNPLIVDTNVVLLTTIYFPCHNVESEVSTSPFHSKLEGEGDTLRYMCMDHKMKASIVGAEVCC